MAAALGLADALPTATALPDGVPLAGSEPDGCGLEQAAARTARAKAAADGRRSLVIGLTGLAPRTVLVGLPADHSEVRVEPSIHALFLWNVARACFGNI